MHQREMISQASLIDAERKYGYRNSSERDTEKLQYDYRTVPPNEFEYDHRGYRIAYRMASRDS